MKVLIPFISLLLMPVFIVAQEGDTDYSLELKGYVKTDVFYDSRQVVSGREGHFLLWPAPPIYDDAGKDINAHASFNMLAVQSRLGAYVTGPEVLGAESSAVLEGDFFGQRNDNINLIRLRHAYLKLQWKHSHLLIGQYWNPVFNLGGVPSTVSFTTGTPVLPFSRNPQIRYVQKIGRLQFTAAVQSQRDYPSFGPDPGNTDVSIPSSQFLKNSGMPEFHAKLQYEKKTGDFLFRTGVGGGYKEICPFLETGAGYATQKTVQGYSGTAFLRLKYKSLRFTSGAIYGANATDVMSIGGFAVSDTLDTEKHYLNYTVLSSGSLWGELCWNTDTWHVGVFGGYVKNFGASGEIVGNTWGVGYDIANMYRIAPRVWHNWKRFRIALEWEHTAAAFGTPDENGIPQNTERVANNRIIAGFYYFFR